MTNHNNNQIIVVEGEWDWDSDPIGGVGSPIKVSGASTRSVRPMNALTNACSAI